MIIGGGVTVGFGAVEGLVVAFVVPVARLEGNQ